MKKFLVIMLGAFFLPACSSMTTPYQAMIYNNGLAIPTKSLEIRGNVKSKSKYALKCKNELHRSCGQAWIDNVERWWEKLENGEITMAKAYRYRAEQLEKRP